MGVLIDRFAKSTENKGFVHIVSANLYGWCISHYLTYKDIRFTKDAIVDEIFKTDECAETGCFLVAGLH